MTKKKKSEEDRRERVREYNRRYYEEHRDEISERRKRLWEDSPEYRQKVRERRVRCYDPSARKKVGRKSGGGNVPRMVRIGGAVLFLYSIGAIARPLKRHYFTIRKWVEEGVLPAYKDDGGDYWFDDSTVVVCEMILSELGEYPTRRLETAALRQLLEERFDHQEEGVVAVATAIAE